MHLPFCVTINVYRGLYAVLKHIILTLYRDLTPTSPHKSTRTSNTNFQTWYATNSYHHLQNEHNSHPTPHGVTQKPPHQSSKHGRPWCPYTYDQSSGQSFEGVIMLVTNPMHALSGPWSLVSPHRSLRIPNPRWRVPPE